MRKFNGIPKDKFELFLKECEWRFNNPDPKAQLRQAYQWVPNNYILAYLVQPLKIFTWEEFQIEFLFCRYKTLHESHVLKSSHV